MIRCHGLSKCFRTAQGEVTAVADVNLELQSGEFVALRGPSGCGKTTLLLALGGMLRPSAGQVWFGDDDLYRLPAGRRTQLRSRRIGFVFQMFHLVPYLTVLENILLTAQKTDPAARERARSLLAQVGLEPRAHHLPGQLSAGERQRAALARALGPRPDFLLADEPTGNLDPENAAAVFDQLARYHQDGGAVLLVTHGAGAEAHATRHLEMRAGRLIERPRPGTPP